MLNQILQLEISMRLFQSPQHARSKPNDRDTAAMLLVPLRVVGIDFSMHGGIVERKVRGDACLPFLPTHCRRVPTSHRPLRLYFVTNLDYSSTFSSITSTSPFDHPYFTFRLPLLHLSLLRLHLELPSSSIYSLAPLARSL
jgi:hypothetical protein